MITEITRDFNGAEEKGLKIFYNDSLGIFEIETATEIISLYDEDGAIEQVQKIVDVFNN